jgi:hypothetical protein
MSVLLRAGMTLTLVAMILIPHAARAADKWVTPGFASGWTNYGQDFRSVSAVKSGNAVTVSGLAKRTNGKWGHIATLPGDMRPKKRLIFNLNTHNRTARVDVLPNGQIHFVAGQTAYNWVSLDGISFVTGKTYPLKLTSGWQNYGGEYAAANELKVGNTITLGGLIKPGAGNIIATLPGHLRPAKRHIFNLNSHDKTSRVDVLPNGQIVWVFRAPSRGWVSLDGIRFERKSGRNLKMVNGWKNYQGVYATATATRIGNRVSVNGLLRAGKWGHMANLPTGMCPEKQLIFNVNNDKYASRVDVYPDCRVVWLAGGRDFGWLSLEGISFVLKSGGGGISSIGNTGNTGGGLQTGAPPSASYTVNDNKMINSAGSLIGNLRIPVLKDQWNTWKNRFRKDGALLKLDVRLFNQAATIVIYRPRGKTKITDKVNVAVLVDNFKISNLIKPAAGTVADDLRVNKVTYIFVPRGNEENINTAALPGVIKKQVEKVRTGPIVIVSGNNMFGIVNNADRVPTASFLKQVNLPLGNLKVNATYGQKKSKATGKTDPYKGVRLTRAGTWNQPFHLKDTELTDPTFEYIKLGNTKTLRAWGTASLKNKPYFMFVQKHGDRGKWPTAAALDTSSISMVDYMNVATIFSNTIFSGVSYYQNLISVTNHLPLNEVRIENPHYKRSNAVDRDNNPVFTNVMIMAANAGDTLPDARGTKGAALVAHGRGKVLGVSVAQIDAQIYKSARKSSELNVKAKVVLPNRGGMKLGNFDFALYKDNNNFVMGLRGRSKITFEGKKIVDEQIIMKISKAGLTYSLGASCPLRPLGVDISINTLGLASGSGFNVKFKGSNPLACILGPLGDALDAAKGAWNTTSKLITSYTPEKFSDATFGAGKEVADFLKNNGASKAVRDSFDDAWKNSGAGSAAKKIVKKAKFW